MDSRTYKVAKELFDKLVTLQKTILGLEGLKNERISKIDLIINYVKNPVIVTDLSKETSDKIVDLLIEHKRPIWCEYKNEFKSL